jgi:hypothetical protein
MGSQIAHFGFQSVRAKAFGQVEGTSAGCGRYECD